jgi:protein TonB
VSVAPANPVTAPVQSAPVPAKTHPDSWEEASPLPEFLSKDYLEQLNRRFSRSMSGRMGEYGKVMLEVTVDKNGQVKSAVVLVPSPHPRLDKFAQDIVATWKFKPAKRNGIAEEKTVKVPFVFEKQRN